MTDKDLKKLSRGELLELLIAQMKENEQLKASLEEAQAQLDDRKIIIDKAGTLAEASLQLNGVFQAAEAAAAQYLENIERMSGQQESVCREMKIRAERRSSQIIQEAQAYSQKTRKEADEYFMMVKERAANVLKSQDALRELVLSSGDKA